MHAALNQKNIEEIEAREGDLLALWEPQLCTSIPAIWLKWSDIPRQGIVMTKDGIILAPIDWLSTDVSRIGRDDRDLYFMHHLRTGARQGGFRQP